MVVEVAGHDRCRDPCLGEMTAASIRGCHGDLGGIEHAVARVEIAEAVPRLARPPGSSTTALSRAARLARPPNGDTLFDHRVAHHLRLPDAEEPRSSPVSALLELPAEVDDPLSELDRSNIASSTRSSPPGPSIIAVATSRQAIIG